MDNHLAFNGEPRKQQRDVFVGGQVPRLAAFVVGEEEKSFLAKAFYQNGSRPRFAIRIDGGQSRSVWLQNLRLAGLIDPEAKLSDGIGVQVLFAQAGFGVFSA